MILLGSACLVLLAAGCGDDDDAVEVVTVSPPQATRCIEEQGLTVQAQASEIDEQIGARKSLLISLPDPAGEPNAIKISFYDSEEAAIRQAETESSFIEGAEGGGSVEQHGAVVVTIARDGNEDELDQVKGCL